MDVLKAAGATVHLAHPLGIKGFGYRRVKTDWRDAADLADLLRMGRLPEAWIAPPAVRELRELVRYRGKFVALRSGLKAEVHAVLAKEGIRVGVSELFGRNGMALLGDAPLGRAYRLQVDSLLGLIDAVDGEVEQLRRLIADELDEHTGYHAIQAIPGATFAGGVRPRDRRRRPVRASAEAVLVGGADAQAHEFDATIHRGHITKQGSRLVRWAAIEAVQHLPVDF